MSLVSTQQIFEPNGFQGQNTNENVVNGGKTLREQLIQNTTGEIHTVLLSGEIIEQFKNSISNKGKYLENFCKFLGILGEAYGIENFGININIDREKEGKNSQISIITQILQKFLQEKLINNVDKNCLCSFDCDSLSSGVEFLGTFSGTAEENKIKQRVFKEEIEPAIKSCFSQIFNLVIKQHQANHDELTGLPNRRFLNKKGQLMFESAKDNNTSLSIFFIDLDYFKRMNDDYSHADGDYILIKMSEALEAVGKKYGGFSFRQSGEELILMAENIDIVKSENISNDIHEAFKSTPLYTGNKILIQSASIGIVNFDPKKVSGISSFSFLCEKADEAMYKQKRKNRNGTTMGDCSQNEKSTNNRKISSDIGDLNPSDYFNEIEKRQKQIIEIIKLNINKIEGGEPISSLKILVEDYPILNKLAIVFQNYYPKNNQIHSAILKFLGTNSDDYDKIDDKNPGIFSLANKKNLNSHRL